MWHLLLFMPLSLDMLAGRTPRYTVDGVMGGRSNAQGAAAGSDGSITFAGSISTDGGGFAYMTLLGGDTMDLTPFTGIMLSFDAMDMASYGPAPISFNVEMQSNGRRCTLTNAFAVPTITTAVASQTKAWVSLASFEPKGSHWEYSENSAGVPASCKTDSTTSLGSVSSIAIGNYYQDGPFKLVLHGMEARAGPPPAPSELIATAPRDGLLTSAAERARGLIKKIGAGVGEAQMAAMAASVLVAAAAQAGDATLVAIASGVATASAAKRAEAL